MFRFCIIIAFVATATFLCPGQSFSQSNEDSLRQALEDARGNERIEILLDLGTYTRQTNMDQTIEEAEEALDISRRLGYAELEARALQRLGYFHSLREENGQALEYYLEALNMERESNRPLQEAEVLHQLGRFYYGQEKYSQALEYYFKALRIREAQHDKNGASSTLYYIGVIYTDRGEHEQALDFYAQSYDLASEIDDYRQMSMSASEQGIIVQNLDSLERALKYFDLAMDAAKKMNSAHAMATILLYMSSAYEDKNIFDRAIELNKQQISIGESENNKFILATGMENLAQLYYRKGDRSRAVSLLKQAKKLYNDIGYISSEVIASNLMAKYLLKTDLSESVKLSSEALVNARLVGMIDQSIESLKILTRAYRMRGNYEKAYQAQARLTALKDSSFSLEQEKQIAEMNARYETGQKEKEIALLQKEHDKTQLVRNAMLAGLILFLVIGLLIYNRQRLKIRKKHTELENKLLKEEKLRKDLDFKNKQLTTHSLNMVQKNETMKELKENINTLKDGKLDDEVSRKLSEIEHLMDYSFNLDEDWEEFRLYFEEVHSGFFEKLHELHPDLTTNEYRLSALVKLRLSIKEIATIMGISPDSVKTARYRLRKKLGMETEENLTEFMMDIEKQASRTSL